jgi:hypothetical protein
VCEWYIHITELPSCGPGPALRNSVGVGVLSAGWDAVVALLIRPVVVRRALAGLVVLKAVDVDAVREPAGVAEDDLHPIADLGADHRPQCAEVLLAGRPLRERGERRVGVAAIEALQVLGADPARPGLDVYVGGVVERFAGDVVAAVRGVVPHDLVRADVVRPQGAVRRAGARHLRPVVVHRVIATGTRARTARDQQDGQQQPTGPEHVTSTSHSGSSHPIAHW